MFRFAATLYVLLAVLVVTTWAAPATSVKQIAILPSIEERILPEIQYKRDFAPWLESLHRRIFPVFIPDLFRQSSKARRTPQFFFPFPDFGTVGIEAGLGNNLHPQPDSAPLGALVTAAQELVQQATETSAATN